MQYRGSCELKFSVRVDDKTAELPIITSNGVTKILRQWKDLTYLNLGPTDF